MENTDKQYGINTKLTYYVSRHTIATKITIPQIIPTKTASQTLRHANIKTIQICAKITKEKIGQDMKALSHKIGESEKKITERI